MRDEYDFSKAKRGAVIAPLSKTRITIMLDDNVIETFRARADADGRGYQTLINAVLRDSLVAPINCRSPQRRYGVFCGKSCTRR